MVRHSSTSPPPDTRAARTGGRRGRCGGQSCGRSRCPGPAGGDPWPGPPGSPGPAQIKGGALHRQQSAGGGAVFIGLSDGVGKDLHLLARQGAGVMAQQVEVAVVGEIAQGVGVAFGPVVQPQHTVGGEGVGHPHLQGAGEALIPVRAHVGEHQGAVHLPGLPYRPG